MMARTTPISQNDILAREKRIANQLSERTFIFERYLTETKEAIDLAQRENFLYKEAFTRAAEDIDFVAFEILVNEALSACIQTGEFNWPHYLNKLETALLSNKDNLIVLVPENNGVTVTINMDLLGTIDEWGEVVKGAREAGGFGLVKNAADRSRMWAEKIYKTAREGRTLSRETKGGIKDITDQYSGKYDYTLELRMSFLEPNKAPFWYIIEHGNADLKLPDDSGGKAYPLFGPTNFVRNAQEAIAQAFAELYLEYKAIASSLLLEELGIQEGEGYQGARQAIVGELKRRFPDEPPPPTNINKLISTVQLGSIRFEAYTTSKRGRVSARSLITGRFISLPTE